MNARVGNGLFPSASVSPQHPDAARLRQLSDETGRIAETLARLSAGTDPVPPHHGATPASEAPDASLSLVRFIIRSRRMRAKFFGEELFGDPAWDILLDLLEAEIAQRRVSVSSLCIAAAVPSTTALRWIRAMTEAGLLQRRTDPYDGRRTFVELTPSASQRMRLYFDEIGNRP